MGAAGFEPEQDLAPLGLAGFESFADTSGSSRPLVAQKWALQDLNRSQRVLLASLRGLPLAGFKSFADIICSSRPLVAK